MIKLLILITIVSVLGLKSCDRVSPALSHTVMNDVRYTVRHPRVQAAHDLLIDTDLNNKQWELEILREIYIAQENEDEDAFRFYMGEYIRVPRLILTEDQKRHPRYREWLSDDEIKSGCFMSRSYDYTSKFELWKVE